MQRKVDTFNNKVSGLTADLMKEKYTHQQARTTLLFKTDLD